MSAVWTDARIARLKELWSDGLSCSMIAADLGAGISRCAVMGKVSRLKLETRGSPGAGRTVYIRRVPTVTLRRTPSHKPRPKPSGEPIVFLCEPRTLAESNTCRFIQGDPGQPGWQMCGQPVFRPGASWCAGHGSIVFQPIRADRQDEVA